MKFKRLFNILIIFFIMIFCSSSLIGCFDLGAFENDQDLYDSFSDVYFIKDKSISITAYDLSDLYSAETINEIECNVDIENYSVMFMKVTKDIVLDEVCFCIYSDSNIVVSWEAFVFSGKPSAKFEDVEDEVTGETKKVFKLELPILDSLGVGTANINGKEFRGTEYYNTTASFRKKTPIEEGKYIGIKFNNASPTQGFGITCLLMRNAGND